MAKPREALLLCAFLLAAPVATRAEVSSRIEAELRSRPLVEAGDATGLLALLSDPTAPPLARGRALHAYFLKKAAPLSPEDRLRLLAALSDPGAEVRQAAVMAVGRLRERSLEAEALRLAGEDPAPGVRIEALRAVRPWTRQGHLYFLEQAFSSRTPSVRAVVLETLSRVPYREVPPSLLEATRAAVRPGEPAEVRLWAVEALKAWNKVPWSPLKEILLDRSASETLRAAALGASDGVAEKEERRAALLEILAGDPSQRLAWEAFRRLKKGGAGDPELLSGVSRFLDFSSKKNAATEEMAAFLRSRGYRVEYLEGAWKVKSR